MKKTAFLSVLLCLVFLTCSAGLAAVQVANDAFTLDAYSSAGMEISFTLPAYEVEEVNLQGTVYHRIKMDGAGYLADTGFPELPTLSTMVAVPGHGSVQIELVDAHTKMVRHILPYPAQGGNDESNPRNLVINDACYRGSQVFPQEIIRYSDPQILRDFRIVTIQLQPFSWDSAARDLLVRDRISLRVRYTDQPGINEMELSGTISPAFDRIYQAQILNYRNLRPAGLAPVPERIVMIHGSYSDQTFMNDIIQFALWKRQKGADVRLVSTAVTGSSNTAIKSYLQNLYNDINSRPDYVVLIGDVSGSFAVPTWSSGGNGDYPYQMLAGTDQLGDVFIGRISAESTSQLEVILAKIYAYERDISIPSAQWLNRMLIVCDSAHDGMSVIYFARYLRELSFLHNPDYTYTILAQDGPSPSSMNQAINQGVGFFSYRGYIGMSSWSPTESLINGVKLPHTVIITCSTGNFTSTGTTESFIRLGTAAVPKGAVTAIGMDGSGTHTMPNNALSGGIFDGIFAQGMRSMGEALLYSKLNFSRLFSVSNAGMVSSFTQWCNLMGDPTMEVYITIPHTFAADFPAALNQGMRNLTLHVIDQEGLPVGAASVTAVQGGIIIARSFSDAQGQVCLQFAAPLSADVVTVTIAKHDFKPLIQQFYPEASPLTYVMTLIDDDNIGSSSGNNNFNANPGETLEIMAGLRNAGLISISGLSGYASCSSPYAVLADSVLAYGPIAPGEMQFNQAALLLQVLPGTPNNTILPLVFHLTDTDTVNCELTVYVSVSDACLIYTSSGISDGSNHALDPGETASFNVTVKNTGFAPGVNVTGELFSDNDLVTVEDSLGFFGDISMNTEASTLVDNFILHGRNLLLPGMVIPLRLKLSNQQGFLQWVEFSLTVGAVTLHDPLGPDAYGYVIYDDTDTSYNECPVYSWVGIAPAEGGSGTALPISDPSASDEGDGMSANSLAVVDLPFTFRFYGQDYQQITVCSNGFLAMGVTQNGEFRNYRIPGAMGPGAMIAPFWDDLATTGGSGIYTWHDAANHQFIIEWYHLVNGYQTSAQETFQVILHDPSFYATSLGDGPIKIQYQTFNNVDSGTTNYNQGVYCTIGIENLEQNVGLEYSFNNTYPTAASPLGNGRALYITNVPVYYENAYLVLGETVVNETNGNNVVEPGETVEMGIQLLNLGNTAAENVTAVLSTADPLVSLINPVSSYHPIGGDGSGFNQSAFTFSVSPLCPDGHVVSFLLQITSEGGSWQRAFNLSVQKSELEYVSYFFNDTAGNNNGIADPNEAFLLIVNLMNGSDVDALNVSAALTASDPLVTLQSSVQSRTRIAPGDVIQFVYPVQFGAIPANSYVNFSFEAMADNAPAEVGTFSIGCGTSGVNLDFEDSNGNLVSQSGWAWGDPSQYNAHSGTNVWATNLSGQYPNNANYILVTPPLYVGSNAVLSFWHLLACESGWDGGNVSVSNNGGSSWNIVQPASGGSYISNITALGEPGFSGGPNSWTQVNFNLNPYAGQEIILRWHFGSDTMITGNGWFIDDVMITGYSIKTGVLSGSVTLSDSAVPSGVRISCPNQITAYPDSAGAYALYLPVGNYTATAALQYYQSAASPAFSFTEQNLAFNHDFTLYYLPGPAGLTVSAQPGEPEVYLTWIAPAEPVYPIQAYKVYRRLGPGSYELAGQVAGNTFSEALTLAGNYYYYVQSLYNEGVGAPSDTVQIYFDVTAAPESEVQAPVNALYGNYPNPFSTLTSIAFSLEKSAETSLRIYNVKGQLVKTLVSGAKSGGRHAVVWDGRAENGVPAASGMYFFRLQSGNYTATRKLMLMK